MQMLGTWLVAFQDIRPDGGRNLIGRRTESDRAADGIRSDGGRNPMESVMPSRRCFQGVLSGGAVVSTAPPNQLHTNCPLTNHTPNQHNSAQIPLISINTENKSCLIFRVWIFIAKFARNKFFKLYVIICC